MSLICRLPGKFRQKIKSIYKRKVFVIPFIYYCLYYTKPVHMYNKYSRLKSKNPKEQLSQAIILLRNQIYIVIFWWKRTDLEQKKTMRAHQIDTCTCTVVSIKLRLCDQKKQLIEISDWKRVIDSIIPFWPSLLRHSQMWSQGTGDKHWSRGQIHHRFFLLSGEPHPAKICKYILWW